MAKIIPNPLISGISGKLSKDSKEYFYTNRVTGDITTRKIGNKRDKEPSPAQLAQRAAFKQKTQIVKKWFNENKPSTNLPKGSALYQTYHQEMETEGKTNDFYHFVWHKLLN